MNSKTKDRDTKTIDEDAALDFLSDGLNIGATSNIGLLVDAANRRYRHTRDLAVLREQWRAHTAVGDNEGAKRLIGQVSKLLKLIAQIDEAWNGAQIGPDGKALPTAKEFQERIIEPQTSREMLEQMRREMKE